MGISGSASETTCTCLGRLLGGKNEYPPDFELVDTFELLHETSDGIRVIMLSLDGF